MKVDLDALTLSATDLARVLRIDRRTVDKLVAQGVLHRVNHRFELVETVDAYCQYKAATGRDDVTRTARVHSLQASAGLKAAQQRLAEEKLKRESGEWCRVDHVTEQWTKNAHEFVGAMFYNVPPRCRNEMDLTLAQQDEIERIIGEELNRLACIVDEVEPIGRNRTKLDEAAE